MVKNSRDDGGDELSGELRRARGGRSLDEVSKGARISAAYLHKLEAGGVHSPSPHVLRRLAEALGADYWALMRRAGYVPTDADVPAGRPRSAAVPSDTSAPAGRPEPTNAEILNRLDELRGPLERIEAHLRAMAEALTRDGR